MLNRKLMLKQQVFIKMYFYFGNATEAVMHVYNVRRRETARTMAKQLKRKPHIREAIEREMRKRFDFLQ